MQVHPTQCLRRPLLTTTMTSGNVKRSQAQFPSSGAQQRWVASTHRIAHSASGWMGELQGDGAHNPLSLSCTVAGWRFCTVAHILSNTAKEETPPGRYVTPDNKATCGGATVAKGGVDCMFQQLGWCKGSFCARRSLDARGALLRARRLFAFPSSLASCMKFPQPVPRTLPKTQVLILPHPFPSHLLTHPAHPVPFGSVCLRCKRDEAY